MSTGVQAMPPQLAQKRQAGNYFNVHDGWSAAEYRVRERKREREPSCCHNLIKHPYITPPPTPIHIPTPRRCMKCRALYIRFITSKQKYYLLKMPFINLSLKRTEWYDEIMQIRNVWGRIPFGNLGNLRYSYAHPENGSPHQLITRVQTQRRRGEDDLETGTG